MLVLTFTISLATSALARDPEPLPEARRVTAGDAHTCAEWWHGATCWGDNNHGQLGNGTQHGLLLAPFAPPMIEPQAVLRLPTTPAGQPFATLDAGPGRTCGIATGQAGTTEGQVWCWGEESALGRSVVDTRAWTAPGVVVKAPSAGDPAATGPGSAPLEAAFSVAVAERQVCALVGSQDGQIGGEVWCWGAPGGPEQLLAHPVPGPDGSTLNGFVTLDGGFGRFCAIDASGEVWCWFDRGTSGPARVPGVADAVAVTVGRDHACAQVRDGTILCWGANDRGQLGDGTTTPADSAVRVVGLDETSPADPGDHDGTTWWRTRHVLGGGGAHTCVLRDEPGATYDREFEMSHAVFCWGANDRGQLGDGSRDDRTGPVRVAGLDPAKGVFDLAAGRSHSCVVTGEPAMVSHPDPTMGGIGSNRSLRCWGANEHGQLGTGDRDDRSHPSTVVMTGDPELASGP